MTKINGLKCKECGRVYPAKAIHVCEHCFGPLEVDYDYDFIRQNLTRAKLGTRAPSAIVIDSSAAQVRIELLRAGMTTTIPHDKQIEARITKVTSLMRGAQWRVFRGTCPNLVSEIKTWEWDEKQTGKPRPRQRCHALDAMGYATLAQVQLPAPRAGGDEDSILNEDPITERVWKPWRKKMRLDERRGDLLPLEDVLEEDPFREVALYPEEFVLDEAMEGEHVGER